MLSRKQLTGAIVITATIAAFAFYGLPMVRGFLIMAGWIGR
jgi:hypothetical protein